MGSGAGEVAIGIFGHSSLQSKDVFGKVVNEVAMIMHHRGNCHNRGLAQQIGPVYETRRLADITLKWTETSFEVREIIQE